MTLDVYRHGTLAPVRKWLALSPEERRRRAVTAVTADDREVLSSLLEAHHSRTHGQVSPETLRKYRLGLKSWLTFARDNAVNILHPEAEHADLWVRELEAGSKRPASVGVLLAGARALYAARRWTRATKVDLDRNVLTVQHGKSGKMRRVLLAGSLVADLHELGPQEVERAVIGQTPIKRAAWGWFQRQKDHPRAALASYSYFTPDCPLFRLPSQRTAYLGRIRPVGSLPDAVRELLRP